MFQKTLAILATSAALALSCAPALQAEGGDDPIGIDITLKPKSPKGTVRVKLSESQAKKARMLEGKARDQFLLKLGIAAVKADCCGKPDFKDITVIVKACCGLTGGGGGKVGNNDVGVKD